MFACLKSPLHLFVQCREHKRKQAGHRRGTGKTEHGQTPLPIPGLRCMHSTAAALARTNPHANTTGTGGRPGLQRPLLSGRGKPTSLSHQLIPIFTVSLPRCHLGRGFLEASPMQAVQFVSHCQGGQLQGTASPVE